MDLGLAGIADDYRVYRDMWGPAWDSQLNASMQFLLHLLRYCATTPEHCLPPSKNPIVGPTMLDTPRETL